MTEIYASATTRVKLHFDIATGFSISRLDVRSGALKELPLDREALDALLEHWPAFRDRALSDAPARSAPPAIVCPPGDRAGPDASSSRSPSPPSPTPPSPTSGSGGLSSATGGGSRAASPPEAPRTLF